MKIYTMGVYNKTKEVFFSNLMDNKIDTFCDIRLSRGVRGAKYSFVNSKKLQEQLREIDINYLHVKSLAPTKNIRQLQYTEDTLQGLSKRAREKLGQNFTDNYKDNILSLFDFESFLATLKTLGSKHVLFFCVEECSEACHRSLVAKYFKERMNFIIKDL